TDLAAAVTGFAGGIGQRALFKLGAGAADQPRAELPADPSLVAAFRGVAERRLLRFSYRGVEREVHPYRLEFVRGRWYLNGFDRARGDDRWFRMDRVEGTVVPGDRPDAFERPEEAVPGLQLDPWVLGGGSDPVRAEIWFDPAVAHSVRLEVDAAAVQRDDEEGLVVSLDVANREGFRSWLLSYLDRAEVRAPADLRAEVVAWLEALVAEGGSTL
ncbi:MAG TPA: WYL domain-containing protein, partial [Aquihabitans sp.]|nr:WYL domain-containing protein [Aquihabitans sp.]